MYIDEGDRRAVVIEKVKWLHYLNCEAFSRS